MIAGHLSGWPRGGFVGVDVFFVISGYLITGLLLREAERAARVSLKSFYARRARRILPASLTVLAVAAVANQVAFSGARVREGVSAIWWALGFAANIHFADTGTDYFQATRPPSLVQHFWSLAVEEQFYLVWPLVIVLVVALVGRRRGPAATRRVLFVLALAATAASFAYAVSQTKSDPTAAYFSTPARAWELGVGAVIASALAHYPQRAGRLGWGRP
ncbi:MAG: acyltransferase, partial [Frankiales bacterium]|nr:acyltransferase [Frankiales bacterium]